MSVPDALWICPVLQLPVRLKVCLDYLLRTEITKGFLLILLQYLSVQINIHNLGVLALNNCCCPENF